MLARRDFLSSAGGIVVAFTIPGTARAQQSPVKPAGPSVSETNPVGGSGLPGNVAAWLAIDRSGIVSVHFGKVELGTGIATAIAQIVADELDVPFANVRVDDADTSDTPEQGYTAGSASLSTGAIPVRQAAAEARLAVLDLAAAHFAVPAAELVTAGGAVRVRGETRTATYAELVAGHPLDRSIAAATKVKDPDDYSVVGKSVARVDIPGKVFGTFPYLHNLRVPGMLHGRVIMPAKIGATIASIDEHAIAGLKGVHVVKRDAFLGVVAPDEWTAIEAMRKLKVTWSGGGLAPVSNLADAVRAVPLVSEKAIVNTGDIAAGLGATPLNATYVWPYQTHGSIGPSCGVASVKDGKAMVWSSTQGVFFLRGAVAQLLALPTDAVRVIYAEGSGCYGHNGSDDAAAAAALLSQAVGAPVRVQYMRDQEHGWDPKGAAMVIAQSATLDAQQHIAAWKTDVWSPSHSTRPQNEAGNLLPGVLTDSPAPKYTFVGGDRDAKVNYAIPTYRVTMHNLKDGVLHTSAMRGLGGTQNTFANESFMDELATAAKADPLAFRLAHLANDARAVDLLNALAKLGAWHAQPSDDVHADQTAKHMRGRGMAFVRYENTEAYVAAIADVSVDRETGRVRVAKLAIAHDCGLIINPDGLRNQIEGNAIQATSRCLKEAVTFDTSGVTSLDWNSYPILRFSEVPEVAIALIDRKHEPVLGAGEATTVVIAPAIANAIHAAAGVRVREAPFTPARVLAALKSA
jgi:nicotinate dehydrogenase subunit B